MTPLVALAALLFVALFAVNWWHRREEAAAALLRARLEPMLADWSARPPSPAEIAWLAALPPAGGRIVLAACLEAIPGLAPEAAERTRAALRGSGLAGREIARLGDRKPAARLRACRVAGKVRDTEAVPLLVERLRDREPAVRREAIRALGDLGAHETLGNVAAAIEAMGEWTNLLLVMALVRLGPAAAPEIAGLLGSSRSAAMTKALLQVTGRLGVAADPEMIRSLAAHPDPEIRVEAVRVLGTLGTDAESSAICLGAMDDPEWPVRALAAWALGRVGDARALTRLAAAMGDPAYWVRHHVAEAMASLGDPGAAALRRALEDPNPFVVDMAAQALFLRGLREGRAA